MDSIENSVRLIPVRASDLDTLKDYVEALYRHDKDDDCLVNIDQGIRSLFRNENLASPYFIKNAEERIGYVILTKYHSVEKGGLTLFIDELYVEDRFRRKGVGTEILERIKDKAKEEGAKQLWVQTEPHNDAARKFFESRGFRRDPYESFELPL